LARRARWLYERYEVHSTSLYKLLEVRILASMERFGEASQLLQECQNSENQDLSALASALAEYVGAEHLPQPTDPSVLSEETRLEISYWASISALRRGQVATAHRHSKEARRFQQAAPLFSERLNVLESRVRNAS
jgi:hypothetical protein